MDADDLLGSWDLEVLPIALPWLVVPVLIDQVIACLVQDSEAVDVSSDLIVLIDVDISDAAVRLNAELLDCALVSALRGCDTDKLTGDSAREVQFQLVEALGVTKLDLGQFQGLR